MKDFISIKKYKLGNLPNSKFSADKVPNTTHVEMTIEAHLFLKKKKEMEHKSRS